MVGEWEGNVHNSVMTRVGVNIFNQIQHSEESCGRTLFITPGQSNTEEQPIRGPTLPLGSRRGCKEAWFVVS